MREIGVFPHFSGFHHLVERIILHAFGHAKTWHSFQWQTPPLFSIQSRAFLQPLQTLALSNKMRHLFPKTGPLLICACKEPSEF